MSIPVSQHPSPIFLPPPPGNHNFVSYICDSNNNYFYGSDTHTSMCQVLLQTLFVFTINSFNSLNNYEYCQLHPFSR